MMDDNDRESEQGPAKPTGMRPSGSDDPDINAVIDEAVNAVDAVSRRREEDASIRDGNGAADEEQTSAAEVEVLRDRLLRTLADFDNYRKRVERERIDDRKYAATELLRDILGVVDNLERALAAEGGLDDLKVGVEMTLRQMEDSLRRAGVEAVEALDREFDPAVHEAVSRIGDPEVETPWVVDEMQRGYTLHERLLRPAIVRVAVPMAVDANDVDRDAADAPAGDDAGGEGGE